MKPVPKEKGRSLLAPSPFNGLSTTGLYCDRNRLVTSRLLWLVIAIGLRSSHAARQPSSAVESLSQQEFNLSIDAAHIIVRPLP